MTNLTIALFILFLALQAADFYSTYRTISNGTGQEANPVVIWMISKIGLVGGLLISKAAAVGTMLYFMLNYPMVPTSIDAIAVVELIYLVVVINNFRIGNQK
jgi:hypothetical protein